VSDVRRQRGHHRRVLPHHQRRRRSRTAEERQRRVERRYFGRSLDRGVVAGVQELHQRCSTQAGSPHVSPSGPAFASVLGKYTPQRTQRTIASATCLGFWRASSRRRCSAKA